MDVWSGVGVGQSEKDATPCQTVAIVLCYRLEYPTDLAQHSVLPFESFVSALVEGSCDHRDDSSWSSELTTVMKEVFFCMTLPAQRFLGECHQVFPYSRLVRRNDHSRVFVTGVWNALHLGMTGRWRPHPPDPPPLRTSVNSVSVVATPGSTPNSSSSERALVGLSSTEASFVSTS